MDMNAHITQNSLRKIHAHMSAQPGPDLLGVCRCPDAPRAQQSGSSDPAQWHIGAMPDPFVSCPQARPPSTNLFEPMVVHTLGHSCATQVPHVCELSGSSYLMFELDPCKLPVLFPKGAPRLGHPVKTIQWINRTLPASAGPS